MFTIRNHYLTVDGQLVSTTEGNSGEASTSGLYTDQLIKVPYLFKCFRSADDSSTVWSQSNVFVCANNLFSSSGYSRRLSGSFSVPYKIYSHCIYVGFVSSTEVVMFRNAILPPLGMLDHLEMPEDGVKLNIATGDAIVVKMADYTNYNYISSYMSQVNSSTSPVTVSIGRGSLDNRSVGEWLRISCNATEFTISQGTTSVGFSGPGSGGLPNFYLGRNLNDELTNMKAEISRITGNVMNTFVTR